jgi:chorismate mutase
MVMTESKPSLSLRKVIDDLDSELVTTLRTRILVGRMIIAEKKCIGLDLTDFAREREIIERAIDRAGVTIDETTIEIIYNAIFDEVKGDK